MVDKPLQHCLAIRDCAFGVATGAVVPLFKNGDQRVCSNQGITLLNLPGKIYSRVLEKRVRLLVELQIQEEQCNVVYILAMDHWTSSILSSGYGRGHGSLPNQSTCVLWIWRRLITVSLKVPVGGAPVFWGRWLFVTGHSISVLSESELCLRYRQ